MIKERPILFSTPMVQAILEGRKTQTRRIVKMPKVEIKEAQWGYTAFTRAGYISFRATHADGRYGESVVKIPYGKPGDLLWVRETFIKGFISDDGETPIKGQSSRYWYKADKDWMQHEWQHHDKEGPQDSPQWKPSIHMPKSAARIWLQVEDVRVERLHDITEEDAKAEGVFQYKNGAYKFYMNPEPVRVRPGVHNAVDSFNSLWSAINGRDSWLANPWVWVIEFKVLSTTGRPATSNLEPATTENSKQETVN